MTLEDIKEILAETGANTEAYYIGNAWFDENTECKLCLCPSSGGYEVFSPERGSKGKSMFFEIEDYACQYFLKKFLRNRFSYLHWLGATPDQEKANRVEKELLKLGACSYARSTGSRGGDSKEWIFFYAYGALFELAEEKTRPFDFEWKPERSNQAGDDNSE
jgi:hypothetical protein